MTDEFATLYNSSFNYYSVAAEFDDTIIISNSSGVSGFAALLILDKVTRQITVSDKSGRAYNSYTIGSSVYLFGYNTSIRIYDNITKINLFVISIWKNKALFVW